MASSQAQRREAVQGIAMVRRSSESLPWALFGAGGFVVAFLFPVHIFLFAIAIPLGWVNDPGHHWMLELLHNPITRIYLFVFCALAFLHAAHRLRFTLVDMLRVKHLESGLGVLAYGAAIAGIIITIVVLVSVP
ncbi:MAG: fumarate reductase subunit D [Candidatus Binataceae bacterium]|nr:fumarate reductase subunit D [Candidatus Binataceae bacterium]